MFSDYKKKHTERTEKVFKRCKENKMVEIMIIIMEFCCISFQPFFAFMHIRVNVGRYKLEAPQCVLFGPYRFRIRCVYTHIYVRRIILTLQLLVLKIK